MVVRCSTVELAAPKLLVRLPEREWIVTMTTLTAPQLNRELVQGYLDHLAMRNLAPSTVLNYGALLAAWLDHVGPVDARRVGPEHAASFVKRPRARRARGAMGAPATRNRDLAILSSFYRFLINVGEMEKNPITLAPRAKVRNRRPQALPDSTFLAVWEAAGPIDRTWLGLGWYCGFRANEIVNLRGDQLTDGAVVGFVRKGGHEDTWPLGEMVAEWGSRLPQFDVHGWHDGLLRSAMTLGASPVCDFVGYEATSVKARARYGPDALRVPTVLNKRLARLTTLAGVEPFGPHALRHSAITNWLRMGVPLHIVQVLAAHSSAEVTSRYLAGSRRLLADWRGGLLAGTEPT
jgi:integrase